MYPTSWKIILLELKIYVLPSIFLFFFAGKYSKELEGYNPCTFTHPPYYLPGVHVGLVKKEENPLGAHERGNIKILSPKIFPPSVRTAFSLQKKSGEKSPKLRDSTKEILIKFLCLPKPWLDVLPPLYRWARVTQSVCKNKNTSLRGASSAWFILFLFFAFYRSMQTCNFLCWNMQATRRAKTKSKT